MRHDGAFSVAACALAVILLALLICTTTASDMPGNNELAQCLTEDDLDFETCTLEHLSISALVSICDRIGLDIDAHVFPLIDSYEEDGGEVLEGSTDGIGGKERTHADYVDAAHECLLIEDEMDWMEEEDPEGLAELERSMLAEDPALLSEVIADVLAKSPDLMKELEIELAREEPELFKELMQELGEGEELAERPEILAELVALMLAEDPDMLQHIDEDVAELMAADDVKGGGNNGEEGVDTSTANIQGDEL